jgi:hypothetical protein
LCRTYYSKYIHTTCGIADLEAEDEDLIDLAN